MLYNLIKTYRGKDEIVMTDSLPKINNRLKTLRQSQKNGVKNQKVTYTVSPASEDEDKFKKKKGGEGWRGGDYAITPPKIK